MTTLEIISLISDIITLLIIVASAFLAVFAYFHFAPVMTMRIIPTWVDSHQTLLLVRIEVENKARVRLYNPQGRIQILEYCMPASGFITQWVPFEEEDIRSLEQPTKWQEPQEIFDSTKQIFPGETIAYERLYQVPKDIKILHIGLQVEMKLGLLGRILTSQKENWRQTTTCFAVKTEEGGPDDK